MYRQKAKKWSRESYRRKNPKAPSAIQDGLLDDGAVKEIVYPGGATPRFVEVFTISQTAVALGKNRLTVRRWIQNGIVPEPIVPDTSHGYMHYTRDELEIIRKVLAQHESEYDYIHATHAVTINTIWQRIEAHRRLHFGD